MAINPANNQLINYNEKMFNVNENFNSWLHVTMHMIIHIPTVNEKSYDSS